MYQLHYSSEKNRIYIVVKDILTDQECQEYTRELFDLIDMTRPDFTILADMTKSDLSVLETISKFQKIREYGIAKGFKNAAHILNKDSYSIHNKQPFEGIKSAFIDAEEAEQYLDTN